MSDIWNGRFQAMLTVCILALAVFGLAGCPLDDPPKPEAAQHESAARR